MDKRISVFLCGLLLISCNSNVENKSESDKENNAINSPKVENESFLSQEMKANEIEKNNDDPYYHYHTIIKKEFKDSVYMNFSNLMTKDRFTFYMPVGNIDSTESVVRIYIHSGDLIYEKKFITRELINGYDLEFIENETQMQRYIMKKAKGILDKSSFDDPNKIEEYGIFAQSQQADFENHETYVECQKDRRPLFWIGLGEEDGTCIGFSRKQNKVLDIIYCC